MGMVLGGIVVWSFLSMQEKPESATQSPIIIGSEQYATPEINDPFVNYSQPTPVPLSLQSSNSFSVSSGSFPMLFSPIFGFSVDINTESSANNRGIISPVLQLLKRKNSKY